MGFVEGRIPGEGLPGRTVSRGQGRSCQRIGTGVGLLRAAVTGFPDPSNPRPVPTRLWRRRLDAGGGGKLRFVSVVHQPHARDPLQLLRGVHLRRSHGPRLKPSSHGASKAGPEAQEGDSPEGAV